VGAGVEPSAARPRPALPPLEAGGALPRGVGSDRALLGGPGAGEATGAAPPRPGDRLEARFSCGRTLFPFFAATAALAFSSAGCVFPFSSFSFAALLLVEEAAGSELRPRLRPRPYIAHACGGRG
jgi:hypothetical protein